MLFYLLKICFRISPLFFITKKYIAFSKREQPEGINPLKIFGIFTRTFWVHLSFNFLIFLKKVAGWFFTYPNFIGFRFPLLSREIYLNSSPIEVHRHLDASGVHPIQGNFRKGNQVDGCREEWCKVCLVRLWVAPLPIRRSIFVPWISVFLFYMSFIFFWLYVYFEKTYKNLFKNTKLKVLS